MSDHLKNKEEQLLELLTELAEESSNGIPIFVEGRKDVQALRALGIAGRILMLKTGGKAFADAQEEITRTRAQEVILLFDFDRRGTEAKSRVKEGLEHVKMKPNLKFWKSFRALVGRDIQCIEGLPAYLETLAKRTGRFVTV